MRTTAIAALIVGATFAFAPAASADRADCSPKLERSYSAHYYKVRHRLGKRAPGRNIRRYGVLFRGVVFDATCGELKRSRGQLVRLGRSTYPTLVKAAGAPAQPPAGVRTPTFSAGPVLEAIAQCESGGNPAAVNPNGHYGKYQFDLQTWQSVGGSGNPAAASEQEQDMRAAALYAQRGGSPWACAG